MTTERKWTRVPVGTPVRIRRPHRYAGQSGIVEREPGNRGCWWRVRLESGFSTDAAREQLEVL